MSILHKICIAFVSKTSEIIAEKIVKQDSYKNLKNTKTNNCKTPFFTTISEQYTFGSYKVTQKPSSGINYLVITR